MSLEQFKFRIKNFDFIILFVVILFCLLSVVIIYSTTFAQEIFLLSRSAFSQLIFGLVGFVFLIILATVDYRLFKSIAWILYLVVLGLLVFVLIWGRAVHGASRWISFGFFDFQPSELAKLVLIIFLGIYFQERKNMKHPIFSIAISFIFTLIMVILVAIQPDLGTSIVLFVIWFGMVLASHIKRIYITLIPLLGALFLPLIWNLLQDYQKLRILTFIDPSLDPLGSGYHQLQAVIAVGSGGILGRGLGHGPQSQLRYLPAAHTDFIFAAIAEELGFIGAGLVLILFAVLIWRILRIAFLSQDDFGMMISVGVMVMILFQVLVNVGMNLGIMPITGIPLPLISYGGSSLVTTFMALGILESIILRHKKISF